MCHEALSIHYLFFADDSFLFACGMVGECRKIIQVLRTYEMASGQAMNFEKSCVSFSPNLTDYNKQLLVDGLGMRKVEFHDKYLGMPVLVRKLKKETFAYIKDRLWKKLQSWWRCDLLSSAGRELLVKRWHKQCRCTLYNAFFYPKLFVRS